MIQPFDERWHMLTVMSGVFASFSRLLSRACRMPNRLLSVFLQKG